MNLNIKEEKYHWTSDEKIKWFGYGEWIEEWDITEFEYLGYYAKVIRVIMFETYCAQEVYFGGHLCGYVKIPENHPYFRKKDIDLECHHGLTFNEAHEEHWVGFHCGHSGDYIPTIEYIRKTNPELKKFNEIFPLPEGFEKFALFNPVYRNMNYCIEQCIYLIDQLDAMVNKSDKAINLIMNKKNDN